MMVRDFPWEKIPGSTAAILKKAKRPCEPAEQDLFQREFWKALVVQLLNLIFLGPKPWAICNINIYIYIWDDSYYPVILGTIS